MRKNLEKITFVLFTFNEEKRIKFPLLNYKGYGKILVVDNESKDKTRNIARSYGAKVVTYKNPGWVETKEEMNFVFRHVDTPWICLMSADEMIPKTCLELYQQIAEEDKYKVVIQNKKTLLYQAGTDFIPGYINIHFFKKGALEFTGNTMHQRGKLSNDVKPAEVLYLPPIDEYSIYHFSLYNSEKMLKMVNSYSNFQSDIIPDKFLTLKIIFVPIYQFLFYFFGGRLFKIGIRGLIASVILSLYYFLSYAKAYEKHHSLTLDLIEKDFQKDKKKLLAKSPQSNILQKMMANGIITFVEFLHRKVKK